jgi:hypothetical protein
MPELAGNLSQQFTVLCINSVELFGFNCDTPNVVAVGPVGLEMEFKEIVPTKIG